MLTAAAVPLRANLALGGIVPVELAGNGDAVLDPGERFRLDVELANVGGAAALAVSAVLAVNSPEAAVLDAVGGWADLAPGSSGSTGGSGGSGEAFEIEIAGDAACGTILPFALTVFYDGGIAPETLPFALTLGTPGEAVRFAYTGPPVFIADSPARGAPGAPALATVAVDGLGGRLSDLDFAFDGDLCTIASGATTVGLEHPFVSNLLIELVAPSGAAAPLIRFADGFGNHFCQTRLDDESAGPSIQSVSTGDNPFTGSYLPAWPLALFDGEDANGVWTLRATDWNPLDVGNIRAFSLTATPAICHSFVGAAEIPAARPAALAALAILLATAALSVFSRRLPARAASVRGGREGGGSADA
jgi:subtilisin-like proprotein convertase family protein